MSTLSISYIDAHACLAEINCRGYQLNNSNTDVYI